MAQDVFLILLEVIALIVGLFVGGPIITILIFGRMARIPFVLHILRTKFFYAYIWEPPNARGRYTILSKEIEKKGGMSQFEIGKHWYTVNEDLIFRTGAEPSLEYIEGRPNPININPLLKRSKSENDYTSDELRDAWNTKVFQDFLRYQNTARDFIIIVMLMVVAVMGALNLYVGFTTNGAIANIAKFLSSLFPTGHA